MPFLWVFLVILNVVYAFFAEAVFGSFLPFVKTEGGWLVGLLVVAIGSILLMLACNVIEEREHNSKAAHH